jgi:hypothetical protein
MVKKFIYPLILLFALSGCFYSVYSNVFPHLKKIRVLAFENRSSEFALGEQLLTGLNREIRSDGRLKPVTVDPDCSLEGSILSFTEKFTATTPQIRFRTTNLLWWCLSVSPIW